MQLKIDVLPAPLGPIIAKSSFDLTLKLTSSRAVTPPKRSVTSLISSIREESIMRSTFFYGGRFLRL